MFKKSVDSIVAKFNIMIKDLEEVASYHNEKVYYHQAESDAHQLAMAINAKEEMRAIAIKDKITKLIEA